MQVSLRLAPTLTILGFATTVYAQSAGVVGSQYESKADRTCAASVCTVSFPPDPSATVIKITRANCIAVSATEPFEVDLRISASSGGPVLKTQYLDIAHSLKRTTDTYITTVNSEVESVRHAPGSHVLVPSPPRCLSGDAITVAAGTAATRAD